MMNDGSTAAPSTASPDHNGVRPVPRVPVRMSNRLTASVSVLLDQRMALIDELDTVRETRAELARSLQPIGGVDDGTRLSLHSNGVDARHQLAGVLTHIVGLQRSLDDLKRQANGATP